MKHFKGLEGIQDASVEELAGVESMNEKAAAEVYNLFPFPGTLNLSGIVELV